MTLLKTGNVIDRIESRRDSRKNEACKVWATLVRKVANDGRDLSEKELSALEDAADDIGVEDVSEAFTSDIDALKRYSMLERESVDSHARCKKLQEDAERATAEIKRLQFAEIPRLKGVSADALSTLRTIAHSAGEAERMRRNVRLFPDG